MASSWVECAAQSVGRPPERLSPGVERSSRPSFAIRSEAPRPRGRTTPPILRRLDKVNASLPPLGSSCIPTHATQSPNQEDLSRPCHAPASRTSPPRSGAPTAARSARPTSPSPAAPVRRERLQPRRPAAAPAQGRLQAAPGDARPRRAARPVAGRRRRQGDERVGDGARRHPLHALVPAADRLDRREARLLLRARRRRHRDRRVLRQGAHPGRAGRVLVPDRRHPRDLRGARLHRLGPDLAGLHPREPERRAAVHPDRVRVVDRRGARPQDPAAALDGRAVHGGHPRAEAARRRRRHARLHHGRARAGVLPDRRAVLLRAPRPLHHRAARCSAPSRRRATSSTTTTSARSPSASSRACSRPSRSWPSSACRSRPATTRSRPTSTRWRRSSRTPTSAPTTSS